jgi:hypothetical protein
MAEFQKEQEKRMLTILVCTFFEYILGADNSEESFKKLIDIPAQDRHDAISNVCESFIDDYYDEFKEFEEVVQEAEKELMKKFKSECDDDLGIFRNIKSKGDC